MCVLQFSTWFHISKMIQVSETEPSHIPHIEYQNKACYSGFTKFACLHTEAVGGSGAAERDNPFTFRGEQTCQSSKPLKNQPVEPHAALSAHATLIWCEPGWKDTKDTSSFKMQAFLVDNDCVFLCCGSGCIALNIHNISVSHTAGSEQKIELGGGVLFLCFRFKQSKMCAACSPLCVLTARKILWSLTNSDFPLTL